MPENHCNSKMLAEYVNDFSANPDLEITVLNKKQIEELNMGLLVSVNKGSTHHSTRCDCRIQRK